MDLTTGSIPKVLFKLSIALVIGLVAEEIIGITDIWFAGTISKIAIAALGISFPILMSLIGISIGIENGTNSLVANALGEKNKAKAVHLAGQSVVCALILSLMIMALTYFGLNTLLKYITPDILYFNTTVEYLGIIILGSILYIVPYSFNASLYAQGDTKTIRNALFIALLINICLNYLFVIIWKFGVTGLALATIISKGVMALYIFYKFLKSDIGKRIRWIHLYPNYSRIKQISYMSIPPMFSIMLVGMGSYSYLYFVSKFGGDALSAFALGSTIVMSLSFPIWGMNSAVVSITGQNYGAKKADRIYTLLRISLLAATLFNILIIILILTKTKWILLFFTSDPSVLAIGLPMMKFMAFGLPALSIAYIGFAVLQGLKKPLPPLIFNIIRQIIFPVVLLYVAVTYIYNQLITIWTVQLLSMWLLAIIGIIFTYRIMKKILKS